MKYSAFFIVIPVLSLLISCASGPIGPQPNGEPDLVDETEEQATVTTSLPAPFLYRDKEGQTLKLVRMLEGGACKNDDQGAVGMFMLYADADDVERIKRSEGEAVFADYERTIEQFAMLALEQAVNRLNFSEDPFALDEEDAQRRLAEQLTPLFTDSIADAIAEFEGATSLTIDLIPLPDSLYFYLDGCDIAREQ